MHQFKLKTKIDLVIYIYSITLIYSYYRLFVLADCEVRTYQNTNTRK
jgi:hypothetical protein